MTREGEWSPGFRDDDKRESGRQDSGMTREGEWSPGFRDDDKRGKFSPESRI